MKTIPFVKLSATGNDFILFDNRDGTLSGDEAHFFNQLCVRETGIGADGILLIETSAVADFKMRYFNADGRESPMCGNGARASAYFAFHTGLAPASMRFEVSGQIYQATVDGDRVALLMQEPEDIDWQPGALEHDGLREGGRMTVGVPHYVLLVEKVDTVDVEGLGQFYRQHPAFAPLGTNVNFIAREADGRLRIRTYERGVERETLACGTGTVASAYVAHTQLGLPFPMTFRARGGTLTVQRDPDSGRPLLQGQVRMPFRGEVLMEAFTH